MESLGQYLRSIREEQNLTIEYVRNEIKLTSEQISAIENNQLSKLGNYGFSRAMVYSYCRFLGADEKITMNLFDMLLPPQRQNNFVPQTPIKEKKLLISINFIWIVAIIIIIVILGSIIWISYSKGYLKRPFDNLKKNQDSTKVVIAAPKEIDKPDTLRQRMLRIANSSTKSKPVSPKTPKANVIIQKQLNADTTDYVNDLIFNTEDSPFNPRF